MTPAQAKALLDKRHPIPPLLDERFQRQIDFIKDPARLKALFCTRRSAKSYTGCLYMIQECLAKPGVNCLFIGLTRQSAFKIVWKDILKVIDRRQRLRCRFNKVDLTMTFPNGSVIWVTGVDADEEEMNKLLGQKYRLAILDEASMYSVNLRNLVYGVLKPAVADERGTICMLGTASNFPRGLFYDITIGVEPAWSLHKWTAFDNPYVCEQWQEEITEIEKTRPLFRETPLFKQWYLNQWVVDTEKLVYRVQADRNFGVRPPHLAPAGWSYMLGVDVGWEDDSAFVLIAFHENDTSLYVVKTYNQKHMTFPMVVGKIQEFMRDSETAPCKVIIDGANKQGVESMKIRSAIPFEYADKQGKVDFIELLNGDLIEGKIKFSPSAKPLVDEMGGLVWKTVGEAIVYPKKENASLPNHLCDAFLYAWRNGYHFQASAAKVVIPKYSKEWYAKQAEDQWEREREGLMKQASGEHVWGDDGGWPSDF